MFPPPMVQSQGSSFTPLDLTIRQSLRESMVFIGQSPYTNTFNRIVIEGHPPDRQALNVIFQSLISNLFRAENNADLGVHLTIARIEDALTYIRSRLNDQGGAPQTCRSFH